MSSNVTLITGTIEDIFARAIRKKSNERLMVIVSKQGNDLHVDLCDMCRLQCVYSEVIANCRRRSYEVLQSSLRNMGIDWQLSGGVTSDAIHNCNYSIHDRLAFKRLMASIIMSESDDNA